VSSVESTNNYAMAKLHKRLLQHETSIFAIGQTSGKGQRGKQWFSPPGENITMSTVFKGLPGNGAGVFPFLTSASIALGCYDFFKELNVQDVTIKWPNDVYINDRKAGGILIENTFQGNRIEWTVAGTGINLNQIDFEGLSRATSISMATGLRYDPVIMGRSLQHAICSRYAALERATADAIMREYNGKLYRAGEEVKLKKQNAVFTTRLVSVTAAGELITHDSVERKFRVGEVEFV
jgi:BirA family biotin operon repressor/biotin-[acetyl-CoA-carboxylase] ligase